jgi:hypothetical protein
MRNFIERIINHARVSKLSLDLNSFNNCCIRISLFPSSASDVRLLESALEMLTEITRRFTYTRVRNFFFSFSYSICSSVSLPVVSLGVLESFMFLYPGLLRSLSLFRMVCAVGVCAAAGFPGSLPCCVPTFTVLQHLGCPA